MENIDFLFRKYNSCFHGAEEGGIIIIGGTVGLHDIEQKSEVLRYAYERGKRIE